MDRFFTTIASKSANAMGQPSAFLISTLLVVIRAICGPIFRYSDTWQLVINTASTVLTFLAVFLIQNSQNRDGAAIQAKLDGVLRALNNARGEFVGIEHLTDARICAIRAALEKEMTEPRASKDASNSCSSGDRDVAMAAGRSPRPSACLGLTCWLGVRDRTRRRG